MAEQTAARPRKPQILKGFRDYQPRQMILRQRIIGMFREIFEFHGFEPIDTPAIEYLEVLTGKAGENEKLMYSFEDQGERRVGLRYDLTVPLSRFVAMHENDIVFPFKRYHIAPVWRAEKPQRGRGREFWQCDADIAGSPSMLADAEVIAIMAEALTAVGLPNFTIRISHRRLLSSLALAAGVPSDEAGTIYRSVDKLSKIGENGVYAEMTEAGIDGNVARQVLDFVTATGEPSALITDLQLRLATVDGAGQALDELDEIFGYLPSFGVPTNAYQLDLSLARGLDYYTGPVYEATVDEPRVGSVAGAGRYDELVGSFLGRPVPATGISLGLERIVEVVQEFDLLPSPPTVAQAMVVVFPDTINEAAKLATTLRRDGLKIDLSLQPRRSVGDQLKNASRKGIPFAVIAGTKELEAGEAAIKDLEAGDQSSIPLDEVSHYLKTRLSQPSMSG
jgi:histidyl-tRNA synthetase